MAVCRGVIEEDIITSSARDAWEGRTRTGPLCQTWGVAAGEKVVTDGQLPAFQRAL